LFSVVSCATVTFCLAAGVATKDGTPDDLATWTYNGTAWSAPSSTSYPAVSMSCPSPTFCAAVDRGGRVFLSDGASSSTTTLGGGGLNSVSCPTPTFCVAVDENGRAIAYNGRTWSTPSPIDNLGVLSSVSCVSSTFCAAVDESGNVMIYNGVSWSAPADIDGASALSAVSCASTSFCVAVDDLVNVLTYDGQSWSPTRIAPSNEDYRGQPGFPSVSCPASTFCAVGLAGAASIYNGLVWSTQDVPAASGSPVGPVSCTSISFCLASGPDRPLILQSDTWTELAAGAGRFVSDLGGNVGSPLSCASAAFCMWISSYGYSAYGGGAAFPGFVSRSQTDGPTTVDGGVAAVSCALASFCIAVDNDGTAWTWSLGAAADTSLSRKNDVTAHDPAPSTSFPRPAPRLYATYP
jgi:hypothetical protein